VRGTGRAYVARADGGGSDAGELDARRARCRAGDDRFRGREELRQGLEFIFGLDFVMAGDSGAEEYEDVTFVTPDVALLRSKLVRAGQETGTGETMADRHINHLRVLQKREGRWVIVSHLISQAKEKGSR